MLAADKDNIQLDVGHSLSPLSSAKATGALKPRIAAVRAVA